MHLGKKGQLVLRILHLAAVSCWFGSVLCVLLLMHEAPLSGSDDDLFGMLRASAVINQYVLVPAGAFGTFFTGLTFSLCTSRGFVKYPWVACKWFIAASLLVVGTTSAETALQPTQGPTSWPGTSGASCTARSTPPCSASLSRSPC